MNLEVTGEKPIDEQVRRALNEFKRNIKLYKDDGERARYLSSLCDRYHLTNENGGVEALKKRISQILPVETGVWNRVKRLFKQARLGLDNNKSYAVVTSADEAVKMVDTSQLRQRQESLEALTNLCLNQDQKSQLESLAAKASVDGFKCGSLSNNDVYHFVVIVDSLVRNNVGRRRDLNSIEAFLKYYYDNEDKKPDAPFEGILVGSNIFSTYGGYEVHVTLVNGYLVFALGSCYSYSAMGIGETLSHVSRLITETGFPLVDQSWLG